MCRWIAYSGAPIYLDELILKPENSLIRQSLACQMGVEPTNGDGFGIGWYGGREVPGVYKDINPAWNNRNLADLAHHIESSLFIAHVRATTGSAIQQSNCHPFRYKNWLFVHNGVITGFEPMRRHLLLAIKPSLFNCIEGTTDSELLFYLALTFGLEKTPLAALEKMVSFVEQSAREFEVTNPLQMTLGLSDGKRLIAVRYSSEKKSRTLFHNRNIKALKEVYPELSRFSDDAVAIVSEPLDQLESDWIEIPESTALIVEGGQISRYSFQPQY